MLMRVFVAALGALLLAEGLANAAIWLPINLAPSGTATAQVVTSGAHGTHGNARKRRLTPTELSQGADSRPPRRPELLPCHSVPSVAIVPLLKGPLWPCSCASSHCSS